MENLESRFSVDVDGLGGGGEGCCLFIFAAVLFVFGGGRGGGGVFASEGSAEAGMAGGG